MSLPELAPRSGVRGIVAAWVLAAIIALAIGIAVPSATQAAWMAVGMGFVLISSFAIQLAHGHPHGFIQRVAASVLGGLAVMGLIGVGLGLASLFAA
ncbi:hypothetical protein [uncultured Microbacterium sp.]|uniref:hypothetical protein n=1 Tax=uncultured Microbacterium sp. TaxID=191216 RepID=UPI0026391E5D|nr:hypothetical protein [uncultured Microbacterium sp.]